MNLLVLDANQRASLAITRSLGRAGYTIAVADSEARTLAGASRHAQQELVYPNPRLSPSAFLDWLEASLDTGRFHAVVPVTEITTDLVARHRDRWGSAKIPCAAISKIDQLSNKVELIRRASTLRIQAPDSVIITSPDDIAMAVRDVGFPAILKPARSWVLRDQQFFATSVHRVNTRAELDVLLSHPDFSDYPFLYQEVIPGVGYGLFALYDRGQPVCFFAHRRLREKPPDGGVSVVSESCALDPTLLTSAKRLLDDAEWHGLAMVEFKGHHPESACLIEVNARFWGSLQLAIDSGIDFPALLMQVANHDAPGTPSTYRHGQRLRWFLGDLDRLYLQLRRSRQLGLGAILRELGQFILPRPFRTRHEVFRWNDSGPAVRELIQYLNALRNH
jgi:predicted ATP-grasp superfamily ATP-dependent carboligase